MCGIAGYWGTGTRTILEEMNNSLIHRGPDDGGIVEIGSVGLAQRRLSIVDLSPAGHQPMCNREGDVSLVFNGEIYNYKELKEEFLQSHEFKGSSDTEVLLHLYEELGESFLSKIQGMFAIALYDTKKGILLLARDHIGKKPLYWSKSEDTLLFGSELKALRKHPACPTKMSTTSLAQYLVYEYIPGPATIYENVFKLAPGTCLIYDGNTVTQDTFGSITSAQGLYTKNFESAKDELHALLQSAVEKRMVADVPVGVFLSGGLDSSTIAYFAQKSTTDQIKTFSVGFKDTSFDESEYAREVATFLGTDHYEYVVGPEDLLKVIHEIPYVLDEPIADSSIIPSLILSEYTSKEVKVVLGGDGSDEIFFGYGTFFAHRVGLWYEKIPRCITRIIHFVVERLPVSQSYFSFDFKAKKFISGFDTTRARRNSYWHSAFTPEELTSICNFEVQTAQILASTDALYTEGIEFWNSLQTEYMKGYLVEDILVKTDRAGMRHGLEVRAPFLDLSLVNFARSLPLEYKLKGRTEKYILKELMRAYLPARIVRRKKKGFGIPIGAWIKGDLKDLFTKTLLEGKLVQSGLFKREGLAILLEAHISGKYDHRKKLWTLFVLALWMEEWS